MIKVSISSKNDTIKIEGHALYDDYGKDIVCSGVSSVVITSINAILTFDKNYLEYTYDNDLLLIKIKVHNNIVDNLILNMINMLKEIEEKYPKNIKIRKEN